MLSIEIVNGKGANGTLTPAARLFATDYDNGQIYRTIYDKNLDLVLDTGDQCYGFWIRTNDINGNIYASFTGGESPTNWTAGIWVSIDDVFT